MSKKAQQLTAVDSQDSATNGRLFLERDAAHLINPLIETEVEGTIANCRAVIGLIQNLTTINQDAGSSLSLNIPGTEGLYRLCSALDGALKYEQYEEEGVPEREY